jgi:DNA-binding CsgD family transcriptional regulator
MRLVHRDLDLAGFAGQVTAVLRRAVPGEGTCLLTLDPATLLPTGEVVHNGLPPDAVPRLAEIEQREPDFNKIVALARRSSPAASLSGATEGHLDASTRQREVRRPHGFADELRVALRDGTGTWGAFTVLREQGSPHFTDAEVNFVASLSPVLAEGVRRTLRTRAATSPHAEPGSPDGEPGLLVLAPDLTAELRDAGADRWLGALAADGDGDLPAVVRAVAMRTRRQGDTDIARARVQTTDGRWLLIRGSLLGEGADARVGIHIEPARAADLAPMIVAAYGLTDRERRVTELVARGLPTNEIAARLHLSSYTVQDHLKAIFDKTGTASRGELVARLFVDHYST